MSSVFPDQGAEVFRKERRRWERKKNGVDDRRLPHGGRQRNGRRRRTRDRRAGKEHLAGFAQGRIHLRITLELALCSNLSGSRDEANVKGIRWRACAQGQERRVHWGPVVVVEVEIQ